MALCKKKTKKKLSYEMRIKDSFFPFHFRFVVVLLA